MGPFTEFFGRFTSDDAGAVAVDWITLSFAVLFGAIIAVYSIFGTGVGALAVEMNSIAPTALTSGPGPAPAIGGG